MAPPRPHDPYNDAPRRPTSRTTHHLQETQSSHALRSTNPSGTRNLFAPISRRPAAATTAAAAAAASNAHVNEVLEDSDDGQAGRMNRQAVATTGRGGGGARTRRARAATETTVEPDEDGGVGGVGGGEFVVRDKAGSYLREVPTVGKAEVGLDEEQLAEDARLTAITREFWASGGGTSGRSSRLIDEEELRPKADVMTRLREAVDKKLTEERWMYEPTDYLEELRIKNHGV